MERRTFLTAGLSSLTIGCIAGCRGYQYGHLITNDESDMVGSHTAGAEVYGPLVDEAVAKLLGRQMVSPDPYNLGPDGQPGRKCICFVGVENKSIEELADFKDQIYQQIDTKVVQSDAFRSISRRWVDEGLRQARVRPESLMMPDNMRMFTSVMEQNGQPFDYLLFATLTSGSTERNTSTQRNYLLTLELVDIRNGTSDKQSAEIRKGYHKTAMGKIWNYNPFTR